jgi:hypothetical protein
MSSPVAETLRDADFGGQEVVVVNTEGVARSRRPIESSEALEPLFAEPIAAEFRSQWDDVQRGFVDDPGQAVKAGDELVTRVIQSLAQSFSTQRRQFDGNVGAEHDSTETLRIELRKYRSLLERLLAA